MFKVDCMPTKKDTRQKIWVFILVSDWHCVAATKLAPPASAWLTRSCRIAYSQLSCFCSSYCIVNPHKCGFLVEPLLLPFKFTLQALLLLIRLVFTLLAQTPLVWASTFLLRHFIFGAQDCSTSAAARGHATVTVPVTCINCSSDRQGAGSRQVLLPRQLLPGRQAGCKATANRRPSWHPAAVQRDVRLKFRCTSA
jgi:hypothetical protein